MKTYDLASPSHIAPISPWSPPADGQALPMVTVEQRSPTQASLSNGPLKRYSTRSQSVTPAPPEPEEPLRIPASAVPPAFSGLRGLQQVPLIKGHVSSVTLPSRLALLGRKGFRVLASLRPLYVGNSVLGYAHVWNKDLNFELYLLPRIFSKSAARMLLFVRTLALLILLLFIIYVVGWKDVNVGRLWVLGTALSLFVLWRLKEFRRAPDGVMAFCRSMGAPETEEYMFSYSWKVRLRMSWQGGLMMGGGSVKVAVWSDLKGRVRTARQHLRWIVK